MASKQKEENWTEEIICPICHEFFTNPISLDCGHNFCRSCITKSREKDINSCPECRERFPRRDLRINKVLENLAEKARQAKQVPKVKENQQTCDDHGKELKWVCQTENKLICETCKDSPGHGQHRELPIEEAIEMYKKRVKSSLESLIGDQSVEQESEKKLKQKISDLKEQAASLEKHIKSEFRELHQILTAKEQRLLSDLWKEEKRIVEPMEKHVQEIQERLKSIEEKRSSLQTLMEQNDVQAFLKVSFGRKRRISDETPQISTEATTLSAGKFKGPLQYVIWREMINSIDPAPASLTLDPNTANPRLILSKDQTMVRLGDNDQEILDNNERFDYWYSALGSEGFTSGRHYWEVKVKNKTEWEIGVARESAGRKGKIDSCPVNGYWTVWLRAGKIYFTTSTRSDTLNVLPLKPQKIGIFLDYEGGQVSFYNADNISHIHTFTHTFTEKIFPYFCPGMNTNGDNSAPLVICGINKC
ncbi:zinc-binding protein A33-like [Hemiscyllium ocellatum]|uniref:zinc-binding protein A33-like n=1 Tax=Hemiscyllium ocellatum TaxID=170820 RepID=UPI002966F8D5|nr:zinc-binding protein A33-like [Hemiscyllium ocellatum]